MNLQNNSYLGEIHDSTLISKIIKVTSQYKDTIYQYDQYDYDFKATADSIKNLEDSIKSYQNRLQNEFYKSYKLVQKSVLIDTNNSIIGFINQFKFLHMLSNKIEKDTIEMKEKLFKLSNSLISLKSNRQRLDKILENPKKEVWDNILKIQTPTLLKFEYLNSKFKVVVINNQNNILKIIPNISGVRKTLMSQYSNVSKSSYAVLMNAGMFEEDGSGVGLLISNRKKINEINIKKNLPGNFYSLTNAIYFSDTLGKNYIKSTSSFYEKYKNGIYPEIVFATQSGPALLIDGIINKELNIRSQNSLIRNGVGVVKNANSNITIFIISETPTTFYELASLFNFLGCDNAMYLDGAVSQLLFKGPNNKIEETTRTRTQTLGPIFVVTSKEMNKDTIIKSSLKNR